jgi:hypothetical protein
MGWRLELLGAIMLELKIRRTGTKTVEWLL